MKNNHKQTELSELTDQELLLEAKKMKSNSITNAGLIGVLIGVIIYGVVKDRFGFLAIIPLLIIYILANKSKHDSKELKKLLKMRNLE